MGGYNAAGYRVGERHHRAKYTDHQIELVLLLHEEGYGCRRISRIMEMSLSHVKGVLRGDKRGQMSPGPRTASKTRYPSQG